MSSYKVDEHEEAVDDGAAGLAGPEEGEDGGEEVAEGVEDPVLQRELTR